MTNAPKQKLTKAQKKKEDLINEIVKLSLLPPGTIVVNERPLIHKEVVNPRAVLRRMTYEQLVAVFFAVDQARLLALAPKPGDVSPLAIIDRVREHASQGLAYALASKSNDPTEKSPDYWDGKLRGLDDVRGELIDAQRKAVRS